jgi:DNA-binding response OmpR family regulator
MAALKLLVVEDDTASLELMAELLQQLKAEVRPLSDSQEASGLIQREKFDGIFLDLKMPMLSGFELAKLARESTCNKTTPLVIVTGRDEQDTMHLSFSVGATYFLQKPIDIQKLTPLLKRIQDLSFENRRRCARVPLNTDVTCTVAGKTLNGLIWNISQGGVQLEVAGLKLGDTVGMSFILPQPGNVVKAQGLVVWAQDSRQGLYFTEMSVECQEMVRAYILLG